MKKELYEDFFKGKKVTVMGLGLLGRGVGDSRFLALHCGEVIVTDKKTREQLSSSVKELEEFDNIIYHLGEHKMEDFENRDFIIKAAGVPFDSEYLLHAKKHGVPVYMTAAKVVSICMGRLPDVTVIGVTGTRGKSTVTQLISHILKENGISVKLGGNIRGVANLPLLDEVEDGDYLVLELDSWQLQGFRDMNISPHISVFTSFMDDHMNYYKNDKEAYFNDKAAIYRNQEKHDVLIVSPQAQDEILKRDKRQAMIVASKRVVPMNMIGEHNQMSAGLAYEAALQCGLTDEEIDTAIATFKPVDGRLEDLGLFRGVRVFNDNNATTGDAVVAGIKAIEEAFDKSPLVITGGADKGLPKEEYEIYLESHTQEVIYLSGTGTDTISLPKKYLFETLEECIEKAFTLAKEGDIILFSPGFASFSKYFNNEYERNDLFIKELKKYI
ncbi:MAG: hypothetical protein RI935_397 [Candidatus Parcubacteria bacterium]|jgi:UDP-N-acetylmuramoylalanine--D-glutamate ligase